MTETKKKGVPSWAIGCLVVMAGAFLLLVLLVLLVPEIELDEDSSATADDAGSEASEAPSDITFEQTYALFSADSNLTDLQKDAQWRLYEGKCVEWTGELAHLDTEFLGGDLAIGFRHLGGAFFHDYEVLVTAPRRMEDELLLWNLGERYTYRARLKSYPGLLTPFMAEWGC